jgi:hypothetical protein
MENNKKKAEVFPALPEKLPNSTYAPLFTAMGITLIFWSIITSIVLTIAGILTFSLGIYIWITNIIEENNEEIKTKP